ncbi:MAG: hypothetical protein OXF93_23240 [Acidobacteria bacterium]|nr:hypothetical protein [Acidobacteriota bacterium]
MQYELTVDGVEARALFAERHAVEGDDLVFYDAAGGVVEVVEHRRVTDLSSLEGIETLSEPEPWDRALAGG